MYAFTCILLSSYIAFKFPAQYILNNKVSFTAKFVYNFWKLDTQLKTQLSELTIGIIRKDLNYFLAGEF